MARGLDSSDPINEAAPAFEISRDESLLEVRESRKMKWPDLLA
jgi:hypothetical protein